MTNIIIDVSRETRMVNMTKTTIGNDGENLQADFVFKFIDEFVDGQARLEFTNKTRTNFITLNKVDETYTIPIKNVITKQGDVAMQLVITEPGTDEIPVFKSNVFHLRVNASINAVGEAPDGYDSWIDRANELIIEMEEALEQIDNLNIEAERVEDGVEITITKKDGTTQTEMVYDGEDGQGGTYDHSELDKLDYESSGHIGFQATISDLETIRTGASLGATAVQDSNYVHTDNNFTNEEKNKLADLENYDDTEVKSDITTIESKIPVQASSTNQLGDKEFINSSIATNTAYFRGTYESTSELPTTGVTNNDYAFIVIYDTEVPTQVKQYNRYKYNGTTWVYEYTLNNSSFTAQQWAAIQSGITSGLVEKLQGIDLTDYVKNTDYATSGTGGVVKLTSYYGYGINSNDGTMFTQEKTYSQYNNGTNTLAISKGTLENVITGKDLADKTYVNNAIQDAIGNALGGSY